MTIEQFETTEFTWQLHFYPESMKMNSEVGRVFLWGLTYVHA